MSFWFCNVIARLQTFSQQTFWHDRVGQIQVDAESCIPRGKSAFARVLQNNQFAQLKKWNAAAFITIAVLLFQVKTHALKQALECLMVQTFYLRYFHPSICLSIHFLKLIWDWVEEGNPDFCLPSDTLRLLFGIQKHCQAWEDIQSLRCVLDLPLGYLRVRCAWKCQSEASRRRPNQIPKPAHLTFFDAKKQRLCSDFPQRSELCTLSLRLSQTIKWGSSF